MTMLYYNYPKIVFRYPWLIHFVYVLNWLTQLRKWYVYPTIKKQLEQQQSGNTVVDLGCGEGQYLLPFAKQFPHIQFIALDNNSKNTAFVKRYAQYFGLKNVHPVCDTITNFHSSVPVHFAWCIGVLHYIKEDEVAVEKMKTCKEVLLYQPINKKIETAFYKWTVRAFNNYDKQNEMCRIYRKEHLNILFDDRFYTLSSKESYGKIGRWSHEIYTALTDVIFHANYIIKPFALLASVVCFPFILLGMIWDKNSNVCDGNGILLHLKSKET